MGNTILGIIIMLISTTLMNIGSVIQKKAVDQLPAMEKQSVGDNVKGVIGSPLWIFGWVLTTLAMLLNMIALGQADMTIIQPLIGFGLVVLVVFSHFYLHEELSRREILGIIIAILGVVILGITASPSREFADLSEILSCYLQPNAYLVISLFLIVIGGLWVYTVRNNYKRAGVIFATIAAMFSVLGLTFSKGLFSIIDLYGLGATLKIWQAYILLVLFIICSTMAIALQQLSFQKGKAVVVTPVFNLSSIVLPLATGYMVFSETIGVSKLVATAIILVGAYILSYKGSIEKESKEKDEESP